LKKNLTPRKAVAKNTASDFMPSLPAPLTAEEREEWRLRQAYLDPITNLPTLPSLQVDVDLLFEKYPCTGVIYLQIGKFSGLESAYGWEIFDNVLQAASRALKEWSAIGEWKDRILSLHFNCVDGFYMIVNISELKAEAPHLLLDLLGHQLCDLLHEDLSKRFGQNTIDLLGIYYGALKMERDPQVRITRQLHRAFKDAIRLVGHSESKEHSALEREFRNIITHRNIRTVFQPIFHLPQHQRVGFEALTRGPEGSIFESPENLFAAARDSSMLMELESICQASTFDALIACKPPGRIFVNTSSNFLSHPIFQKRLKGGALKKLAPSLVLEITEKEAIANYHDFRNDIKPVRKAGIHIAVDDAGSGYADLESIAEVRPEYIKIANCITRNVSRDLIKQEIITSFLQLARKLKSTVIAEGIETRDDFHALKRLGVEYGQGYFLGRPAQLVEGN
jgi:EAL domain-containing protein (putative c-di-GMP-specific phosphodiesterase class I)